MKLLVSQKKKDLESKLKFWLLVSQKKKDSDKKPKKRLLELPSKKDLLKKLQQLKSKIGLELKLKLKLLNKRPPALPRSHVILLAQALNLVPTISSIQFQS